MADTASTPFKYLRCLWTVICVALLLGAFYEITHRFMAKEILTVVTLLNPNDVEPPDVSFCANVADYLASSPKTASKCDKKCYDSIYNEPIDRLTKAAEF